MVLQVFDLLAQVPLGSARLGAAPPERLPQGWKDRFSARQRIVNIMVVHAKAAPQVRNQQPVAKLVFRTHLQLQ